MTSSLGHEKMLTTFSSYGEIAAERQRDIIRVPRNSEAANAGHTARSGYVCREGGLNN
jgi:hypothetical protein